MTTHQIDLAVSKDGDSKGTAKAGPHGNLIAPKAGKLIRSVGGLGMLSVKFMKYVGNDGQTISIDINLRPIDNDENRTTYLLGNGLSSGRNNTTIDVHFSSRWACGSYNLVITEHQLHKGVHISFQAAAPKIKITCVPLE
ncbi:hypothetical protein PGT21_006307 [Puccinia graminis f. sp. tritici]|uniref:Uncharacterized protein n=1 Tax=Puccinia graminis f. sp. tritici TaxID=56615 RepID=A0A5B0MVN5_PUCGR|nr:hypothetical protein PGTUg99_021571 [Puccinia graminis f. sp. tritici]KAA1074447.1 hypothetical protein PGT21_005566 [Puccinia graminis f. sp. tritici]KAA1080423.1 hypothetical protein PGT21_006307 [Puccinia graminis f. sp. tritici]KAA1120454.1 hypothetical protein PGTUg99_020436 [Puccinia graminis f. sp. tritici]